VRPGRGVASLCLAAMLAADAAAAMASNAGAAALPLGEVQMQVEAAETSGGERTYIPVRGSAWRIAVASVTGDGRKQVIYGAYDGAVRCQDLDTDELLWEVPLGAFPFGLAAADADGDGRAEVFAAAADGGLYAIGPDGEVRWTFRSKLPLYDVAVGRMGEGGGTYVACGGIDRQVYVLTPGGAPVAQHGVTKLVQRLAIGDLDGDGRGQLLVIDARIYAEALALEGGALRTLWRKPLRVPARMRNWENPGCYFFVFSLDAGDLDGDGADEFVVGDSCWNRQAVMAASGQGEPLWITDPKPWRFSGETYSEYYSTAFVRVADVLPDLPGREVVVVTGGVVELLDRDGNLLDEASAPVGFTDLALDGRTLYLGSSPNGDDTVYRVELTEGWPETVGGLARRGVAAQVGENLAALRDQVLRYEGRAPAAGRTYDVKQFGSPTNERGLPRYRRQMGWLKEQFPYANLRFVGSSKVIEATPPTDAQGRPWSLQRWDTDSINGTMTVDEIVARARWIEEHEVPTVFLIGHSCMPFITLETAEKMLDAAPRYLVGFLSAEDEQLERIPRYFAEYFGPLAELCAEHGGRACITKNKNVWWMSAPSMRPVYDALFSGERGKALVAAVEDSNSRTPEINLLSRFGLRQAGLADRFEAAVISDLFSFCRFHQWEYPKHGHPYLRLLVAQTVLGASEYAIRTMAIRPDGGGFAFSDIGRESEEVFLHMLGKGLVFSPGPGQIAGMSPVGITVHQPPEKWLRDGHNGHNPEIWEDDEELHNAVIPHNGCLWGMTETPPHALQAVLLGKERQFGHLFATPYGPFAIVPAHADLTKVAGVREWWHTDGIYAWRAGGERLTGVQAAEGLRESFEQAANELPFRARGDDVFFHAVRMDGRTYRLYAIDPGWLDPQERRVTVDVQLDVPVTIRDLLSGEPIAVRDGRAALTVPAGSLRVLEARAQ